MHVVLCKIDAKVAKKLNIGCDGGGGLGATAGGQKETGTSQFHLLARRGSLPLLMVTDDFEAAGGPPTVT